MKENPEDGSLEKSVENLKEKSSKSLIGKRFETSGALYEITEIEKETSEKYPDELWYCIRMIEPPHSIETIPIETFQKYCKSAGVVEIDKIESIEFEFSSPSETSLITKIRNRILGKKDYTCPKCGFESNDRKKFTDKKYSHIGEDHYCKNCMEEDDYLKRTYIKTKIGNGEIPPNEIVGRNIKLKFHFGSEAIFDIEKVEDGKFITENIELNRDGGHSFHDFWKDYENGRIKWEEGQR